MSLRPINVIRKQMLSGLEKVQAVSKCVNGVMVRAMNPTFIPMDKQLPLSFYTLTAEAKRNELQKVSPIVLRGTEEIIEMAEAINVASPSVESSNVETNESNE